MTKYEYTIPCILIVTLGGIPMAMHRNMVGALLFIISILCCSVFIHTCSPVTLDEFYGEELTPVISTTTTVSTPTSSSTEKTTSITYSETSSSITYSTSETSSTTETSTTSSLEDTLIPYIVLGPYVTDILDTTASVIWVTNEITDAAVEYSESAGFTPGTGTLVPGDTTFSTTHMVLLSSLSENTTYYYRVISNDEAGNELISNEKAFITHNYQMLQNLDLDTANRGDTLTLSGVSFGSTQPLGGYVSFEKAGGGKTTGTIISWQDDQIEVTVPNDAVTGEVNVYNGTTLSNGMELEIWLRQSYNSDSTPNHTVSLCLDDNNNPYVFHVYSSSNYPRFNYYDGASWTQNNPVGGNAYYGGRSGFIHIDESNKLHLVMDYEYSSNRRLIYGYWNGVSWNDVILNDTNYSRYSSVLYEDSTQTRHIGYYLATGSNQLEYLTCTGDETFCDDSGNWTKEVVDPTSGSAVPNTSMCSIVQDSSGIIHIAYYGNSNLKWATRTSPGNWGVQTIDNSGDVGQFLSAACNDTGCYIAYNAGNILRFASQEGAGSWSYELVDASSSANLGQNVSLALDSEGIPHVAYTDTANTRILYALKEVNSWDIIELDTQCYYPSIQISTDDRPYVAYAASSTNKIYVKSKL